MVFKHLRHTAALALAGLTIALLAGCSAPDSKGFTRMHLENDSDTAVTFLAIGTSEVALEHAENRLAQPLPPHAVYSAVLSRPGNYWVRTEVETDGYMIKRVEGPVRLGRGVSNWQFNQIDSGPLYPGPRDGLVTLSQASEAYSAAGRMSLSSN